MSSLFGISQYHLDPKNRLFLPPKFRQALKAEKGSQFIITTGLDKCLYLFLPSRWEALLADNMKAFSSASKDGERAFKRFFFGNAAECPVDALGRILIGQNHKEYAGLSKKVFIVGVGNKAEIWSAERWNRYKATHIDPKAEKFSKIYDI